MKAFVEAVNGDGAAPATELDWCPAERKAARDIVPCG
jgi:hypothetical protein